ncbi:DgyrCDS2692 [Dimorphilus gyrociliatus]|uniref:DgyrCDS2692 n=1 Tax=Dimorphilus gyrociliatus TaxID=2664684 RepID=A0A7I8VCZ3_9ANNE|nr:DgyrCDS2692 [Dimorphilus gyrociliatus]
MYSISICIYFIDATSFERENCGTVVDNPKQVTDIILNVFFIIFFTIRLENNGDPMERYANFQKIHYWQCVYWLLVTMSTVGFGDVHPSTILGRALMVLFIIGSFVMFTKSIPEIVKYLGESMNRRQPYVRYYGRRHILICGQVTTGNVPNTAYLFHDKENAKDIDLVFLGKNKIDCEIDAFFKRCYRDVAFFIGTPFETSDLKDLHYADSIIILADRQSKTPYQDDKENILQAIAIKSFYSEARIILQLLKEESRLKVLNIASWRWQGDNKDQIICFSELRNGILAQNCMIPGFISLYLNLFIHRNQVYCKTLKTWQNLYLNGANHKIKVIQNPPNSLLNRLFFSAVELCWQKLNIILFAVEESTKDGSFTILNPGAHYKITGEIKLFFITPKDFSLREGLSTLDGGIHSILVKYATNDETETLISSHFLSKFGERRSSLSKKLSRMTSIVDYEKYHIDYGKSMDKCTIRGKNKLKLQDHVIVYISAVSTKLNLLQFIVPMRYSSIPEQDLIDIVLVCDLKTIEDEWDDICYFKNIHIVQLTNGIQHDFSTASITTCRSCLVFTAPEVDDADVTLATLAIKSMLTELHADVKICLLTRAGHTPNSWTHRFLSESFIPVISSLDTTSNIQFLEEDRNDSSSIVTTASFAGGNVLPGCELDAFIASAYTDSSLMTIAKVLATGRSGEELHELITRQLDIKLIDPDQGRVVNMPINAPPLSLAYENTETKDFGSFFTKVLRDLKIICLALYRRISESSKARVTLTMPKSTLPIQKDDHRMTWIGEVICLLPCKEGDENLNFINKERQ